jgi:hypothetical protein
MVTEPVLIEALVRCVQVLGVAAILWIFTTTLLNVVAIKKLTKDVERISCHCDICKQEISMDKVSELAKEVALRMKVDLHNDEENELLRAIVERLSRIEGQLEQRA